MIENCVELFAITFKLVIVHIRVTLNVILKVLSFAERIGIYPQICMSNCLTFYIYAK